MRVWSDASHYHDGRPSAYATVVVQVQGEEWRVVKAEAGLCPAWVNENVVAEAYAAICGIVLALELGAQERIEVNMDSTGAMLWLELGLTRRSRQRGNRWQVQQLIDRLHQRLAEEGTTVELLHVPAHQGARANRSGRVNQLCDRLAGRVARGHPVELEPGWLTVEAGLTAAQDALPCPEQVRPQAPAPPAPQRAPRPAQVVDRCVVCGLPAVGSLYCGACSSW